MENETWRDLPSKPDVYQVSSKGRVYRKPYYREVMNQYGSTTVFEKGKILSPSRDSKGYLSITAMPEKVTKRVHRMVAEAFLEPPSEQLKTLCEGAGYNDVPINHIDENVENNSPNNLEWCTQAHNNKHSTRYGRPTVSGSASKHAKLKEGDVDKVIKLREDGWTQQRIADLFGVKQITISNILTGKSWAHYTGIARSRKKYNQKTPYVREQSVIHH